MKDNTPRRVVFLRDFHPYKKDQEVEMERQLASNLLSAGTVKAVDDVALVPAEEPKPRRRRTSKRGTVRHAEVSGELDAGSDEDSPVPE